MTEPTQISQQLLDALITKYKTKFETRFNKNQLSVYFTPNGQPPHPDEYRDCPETEVQSGLFVKVDNDYRIGIDQNSSLEFKLLTFFHEYGHALYRRETAQAIDNPNVLIKTETHALLTSLRLAEAENLPQIAALAVATACALGVSKPLYLAAMTAAKNDSLWIKYFEPYRLKTS